MFFSTTGMGGDFDEFTSFLESDTKFMRSMFRDMGKNARVRGKRSKKAGGGGGPDMDDMISLLMMGGFGMPQKK